MTPSWAGVWSSYGMAADWKARRSWLVDWKEMLESSTSITSVEIFSSHLED